MLEISNHKWKYLRESEDKYFDAARNTALKTYLSVIFPGVEFSYNSILSKEYVTSRCPELTWKRYKPDAVSNELMLVIEFDGFPHYQDTKVVMSDVIRDNYFTQLGYRIIRIPYFVQLSNANIQYYFNRLVSEEICALKYSFTDCSEPLAACPGSMCEAGRARFVAEFKKLPPETQSIIRADLQQLVSEQINAVDGHVEYLIPESIQSALNIVIS